MASQKKIILYSCLVNSRDKIKPIEFDKDFEHILFTDDLSLKSKDWKILPLIKNLTDPTRTCRFHKHNAFNIFPEAEYAIWLDMTHWQYNSIKSLIGKHDLCLHKHETRNNITDEANLCAKLKFDSEKILMDQIKYYKKYGYQDNHGLYSTSCLIMKNTYKFKLLSELWWDEICKWSKRDQISLPYCLWRLNIEPKIIEGVDRNGYSLYFKFKSHHI